MPRYIVNHIRKSSFRMLSDKLVSIGGAPAKCPRCTMCFGDFQSFRRYVNRHNFMESHDAKVLSYQLSQRPESYDYGCVTHLVLSASHCGLRNVGKSTPCRILVGSG